jgi:hypothetical protein
MVIVCFNLFKNKFNIPLKLLKYKEVVSLIIFDYAYISAEEKKCHVNLFLLNL